MSKKSTNEKTIVSAKQIGKDFYNDLIKPTATTLGKIIALPFKAIDAALSPIKQWIDNKNYNYEKTRHLLAEKLKNTNEAKIVEPEAYVAVPALQQLAYSYNSEDLRNMYANLLASAMVEDTKWSVHPSFAEIIKQLSPLDARAMYKITMNYIPIVTIITENKVNKARHDLLINYCMDLIDIYPDPHQQSASLQNLKRLGLINITYEKIVRSRKKYHNLSNDINYQKIIDDYKNDDQERIIVEKGLIELTDFGLDFCNICCS